MQFVGFDEREPRRQPLDHTLVFVALDIQQAERGTYCSPSTRMLY
jgi:hypothetical protein